MGARARTGDAVALVVLGALALGLAFANPVAERAAQASRQAAVAAVTTYAALRSMRAVLSVLEDADVGVSVVVASGTVSPGQVLEPLTRTLERSADILFAAALVALTLAVLLDPAARLGAAVAAGALLLLSVLGLSTRPPPAALARLARSALTLGLVAALGLPLAYAAAFWAGERLTAEAAGRAAALLQQAAPAPPGDVALDRGVVDRVQDLVAAGNALLGSAGEILQATLDLSVAYLVKLVVLPLLVAWVGWRLVRAAATRAAEP